jgi:hypothetical protein
VAIVSTGFKVNATGLAHDIILKFERDLQLTGGATGGPFGWA